MRRCRSPGAGRSRRSRAGRRLPVAMTEAWPLASIGHGRAGSARGPGHSGRKVTWNATGTARKGLADPDTISVAVTCRAADLLVAP